MRISGKNESEYIGKRSLRDALSNVSAGSPDPLSSEFDKLVLTMLARGNHG